MTRLLDEEMTDKERAELQDAEAVCRRFLAWDLDIDQEDVKDKLKNCLGGSIDEDETAVEHENNHYISSHAIHI